jgi:hypothetical protein
MDDLRVEPTGESDPTYCECCGNESRTVWGYVYRGPDALAAYFVQWTRGSPKHPPNFDFLVGTWGDDSISDKKLISLVFHPTHEAGGSFMVIDAAARPAAKSSLCSQALSREEVVLDSDLMELSTKMIDAVWLGDSRVEEVKRLASVA